MSCNFLIYILLYLIYKIILDKLIFFLVYIILIVNIKIK